MSNQHIQKINVLIAEDCGDHQELLKEFVAGGNPEIVPFFVKNGEDFKQAVKHRRYDCLVLDFNLGSVQADKLLQETSNDRSDCPTLVMSSSTRQDIVVSCLREGSIDFLSKQEAFQENALRNRILLAVEQTRKKLRDRRRARRQQAVWERRANTDPLTKLNNRRYFEHLMVRREFTRDRRLRLNCILFDIDHFKSINDEYGHSIGDQTLKAMANLMVSMKCPGSEIFRWGGEEFLVLHNSESLSDGWLWCEQFRKQFQQKTFTADDHTFNVTASAGLVHCPTEVMGYDVIDLADQALYLAKQRGRNQICTWPMTVAEATTKELRKLNLRDPEVNRQHFIKCFHHLLGPTQKEHITRHCQTVMDMAEQIGLNMGLQTDSLHSVKRTALFHDLGKALVPEDLLSQPGPLTENQRELMNYHADWGADMARDMGVDPEVEAGVRLHHVHFDKTPPDMSLPLTARVVSVADTVSAMLSERSYRKPLTHSEVNEEIAKQSGTQFDPKVTAVVKL